MSTVKQAAAEFFGRFWLVFGGRFPAGKIVVYIAAPVLAAIAASAVLYVIAGGKARSTLSDGFAVNGYGDHFPAGYTMLAAIVSELLLTFFFLLVIHGVTERRAPAGLAPLAGGLALTLIHLISIPLDNTSVNPARSLAPALFLGGWALGQPWLFIVFPIVGAAMGGLVGRCLPEVPKSARASLSPNALLLCSTGSRSEAVSTAREEASCRRC
jgi:aquaporin Z